MIVLDTSCAMALADNTKESFAMRELLFPNEEVVAPDFMMVEAANASWKYFHVGSMTQDEANELRERALESVDRFIPSESLIDEAFGQAVFLNHSVYDMVYLVLARRYSATLATFDKKLRVLAEKSGVGCLTVIDF